MTDEIIPPTCLDRANRARAALATYNHRELQSTHERMVDLLTDLRHLAFIEKVDLAWIIDQSHDCMIEERDEESGAWIRD